MLQNASPTLKISTHLHTLGASVNSHNQEFHPLSPTLAQTISI